MKIDMTLEIKDIPGSLIRALEPISMHGGNIVSIMHSRNGKENVIVQAGFKVKDQHSLNLIKKDLKKNTVHIQHILLEGRTYYSKKTINAIMIGHVIDTDIRETVDRINEIGLVSDLDIVMPSPEEPSSVLMNIDVDNGMLKKINKTLAEICKEKGFLLIKSI